MKNIIQISLIFLLLILGIGLQSETQFEKSTRSKESLRAPSHTLIMFGAGGDLSKRKLIPALLLLEKKHRLPENFVCIGVGRLESKSQFLEELLPFIPTEDLDTWNRLKNKFIYIAGDFNHDLTYRELNENLNRIERYGSEKNRLYFLATPEICFAPIIQKLDTHQLINIDENLGWSRVVIEKPFGRDLDSAIQLHKQISSHLAERQIYLIDHYLGKEIVHGLLAFRFNNPLIESFWSAQYIDHVKIIIHEDIGIGSRGHFWEQTGLLRDIIQNHMMQLLSLVAMEKPKTLAIEEIRREKVRLINTIKTFKDEEIDQFVLRGQYGKGIVDGKEVIGYREEDNVDPNSHIETFLAAKLFIDNERWSGVPFYIEAGKRLPRKICEIVLTFKCALGQNNCMPNQLILQIQPKEEISLYLNSSLPGFSDLNSRQKISLDIGKNFQNLIPEAYERLLFEAMCGNSTNFVSCDEHLASWRLWTSVLEHWNNNPPTEFPNYSAGSLGPIFPLQMENLSPMSPEKTFH